MTPHSPRLSTPHLAALVAVAALAPACFSPERPLAGDDGTPADVSIFEPGEMVGHDEDERAPQGVYVVTDTSAEEPAFDSVKLAGSRIFYMNRDGGTYHRATSNNSSTNATTIGNSTSVIAPWDVNDEGWDTVMTCVRDMFSRFDVTITDVDPGDIQHIESVVAGRPEDLGLPKNIGGISPFASNCSVIDRSIVYTFAELFGDNYQFACQVVAQEVAHSFGLDHELLCEDPMTYLGGCGAKTFQDEYAPCGESEVRPCACGAATQNSVEMLASRIGAPSNPGDPQVAIISPVAGDLVDHGFEIEIEASDDDAIDEVRVSIDGVGYVSLASEPYRVAVDMELEIGPHLVEVEAVDMTGASSRTSVEVLLIPGGNLTDPQNPLDGLLPGCSTAAGTGDFAGLGLALLALCLGRRRRRARRGVGRAG